jgi:hypothetical protein
MSEEKSHHHNHHHNRNEKEHGKGTIVFLVGNPYAGKSTICNKLIATDKAKPKAQRLGWKVWGQDLEEENWGAFKKAKDDYSEAIKGEGNSYIVDCAQKISDLTPELFERIFDKAIQRSRKGEPIILDMLAREAKKERYNPNGLKESIDIVRLFQEHLKRKKFSCPTYVAVAYCDVPTLVAHASLRNEEGIRNRKPYVPPQTIIRTITSYNNTYTQAELNNRIVDIVTPGNIIDSIKDKHTLANEIEWNTMRALYLKTMNGMLPDNKQALMFLQVGEKRIGYYDAIVCTEARETPHNSSPAAKRMIHPYHAVGTDAIVQSLNNLATNCSVVRPADKIGRDHVKQMARIVESDNFQGKLKALQQQRANNTRKMG